MKNFLTASKYAEIQAIARELAQELFILSRISRDNITTIPTFTLKGVARKAHTIAEMLKP